MAQTKTTTLAFKNILEKAKSGNYKLPAFQRKWKWTSNQVISLYNSLRLSYPIGSFLFLTSEAGNKLGPRAFHGAGARANANIEQESLVLDGQQRITAGLAIYYGLEDDKNRAFYIDCNKIKNLIESSRINIEDETEIRAFALNVEIDDGYIIAKKSSLARHILFHNSGLLCTSLLTEEKQDELDDILDNTTDKRLKDIVRKVVRKYFKPNFNIQLPIIELGGEFDFSAISKIFSTINSSGKPLTPFELVVAILYPNDIKLEDEIEELKIKYPFYKNMDKNGEILLQTIAMKGGRNPKKSLLPENIDHNIYKQFSQEAALSLNNLGEFLTKQIGAGLDYTDKLVPYDALFAPMCLALEYANSQDNQPAKTKAYTKLRSWFVASAISQRYQEGVHSKQENDLKDVIKWIKNDTTPEWISDVRITPSIKSASPHGAIGKLFTCILNQRSPKDPMSAEDIKISKGKAETQIHHIFPTRWVQNGILDFSINRFDSNLALNTMLLTQATNGDWLNFDPKTQVEKSEQSNPHNFTDLYESQLINSEMLSILKKPEKTTQDFKEFIDLRYKQLINELKKFGINETSDEADELVEMDIPIED